jgi:hypothetical protein
MILGSGQRLVATRGLGGSTVNRFKHFKDNDPSVLKIVTKMGYWAKKKQYISMQEALVILKVDKRLQFCLFPKIRRTQIFDIVLEMKNTMIN